MKVERIATADAFRALEPAWNALVARFPGQSVFLRHEWLRNAFAFLLAPDRSHWTLALPDGDGLAGALPLLLCRDRWRFLALRELRFPTDPIALSVRCDLLLDAERDAGAAVEAIGRHLAARKDDWDRCVLDAVPEDSPLLAHLDRLAAAGLRLRPVEASWGLHRLAVEGDWDGYLKRQTSHLRQHLRREERKLRALGDVETAFLTEPADVAAAVDAFFEIEKTVSKRERGNYTPLTARHRDYYASLFGDLARSKRALAALLRIDGAPAACILGARHDRVMVTLNDVFHPRYAAGYPGHGLRKALVRHAFENGYRLIDFNGHGPHIERWRTRAARFYRIEIFSPSRYGRLLEGYRHRLRPAVRRLLPGKPAPSDGRDRGLA